MATAVLVESFAAAVDLDNEAMAGLAVGTRFVCKRVVLEDGMVMGITAVAGMIVVRVVTVGRNVGREWQDGVFVLHAGSCLLDY